VDPFARFTEILLEKGNMQRLLNAVYEEVDMDVVWKEARTGTVFCAGAQHFCERVVTYPLKELMRLYAFREVRVSRQLVGHLLLNAPNPAVLKRREAVDNGVSAIRLFYGGHRRMTRREYRTVKRQGKCPLSS
jgi:hypothetical protein